MDVLQVLLPRILVLNREDSIEVLLYNPKKMCGGGAIPNLLLKIRFTGSSNLTISRYAQQAVLVHLIG